MHMGDRIPINKVFSFIIIYFKFAFMRTLKPVTREEIGSHGEEDGHRLITT